MKRLAILGAGSWGTALAVTTGPNFSKVSLWSRTESAACQIERSRENQRSLAGIRLPGSVHATADIAACLDGADAVVIAVPCAHIRDLAGAIRDRIPRDAILVSAAKGLEPGTLLRMSQVIFDAADIAPKRVVALSGPSFAQETASGRPTAVVVAGDLESAQEIQAGLAGPTFRVYSSGDITGVEIGGALKNVVAIGAGMADGLGLGHNAIAALVTRGLAEITRLACALGAESRTLSGLAGLGDLVLTCTGELSRNRSLGQRLSTCDAVSEVLSSNTATTEGVRTAGAALQLGERLGIEMPIAAEMQAVLEDGRPPKTAIRRLMERSLKQE